MEYWRGCGPNRRPAVNYRHVRDLLFFRWRVAHVALDRPPQEGSKMIFEWVLIDNRNNVAYLTGNWLVYLLLAGCTG